MIPTETQMAIILETIVDVKTIIPKGTPLAEQIHRVLKEYHAEAPSPEIELEDGLVFDVNRELAKNFGL